jgi:predicted ArsR family transcriptional regulator
MSSAIICPVVSSAGVRVLRTLIGHSPKTVADLIAELQVTRTAVITQLNELMSIGFIEQQLEYSTGPGRPRFRYSATDKAVAVLYGGLQQYLVPALLRSVQEHTDDDTFQTVCSEVAVEVVSPLLKQITSDNPQERLKQFVKVQKDNGRLIDYQENADHVDVIKYACPFVTMIDENRVICKLDIIAMQRLADDKKVELAESRFDGHPCCIFRLKK